MPATVGLCRLCLKRRPLIQSHVVPRFVYVDLKRRYRVSTLIQQRADKVLGLVQDGPRQPLMCAECDRALGESENTFAERFYRPFIKRPGPIQYGPWLSQFCALTSWRVLLEQRLIGGPPNYSEEALSQAEEALATWRAFLLGERADVGRFEFHIVPLNQGPTYDEWMIAGAIGSHAYYHAEDESAFVISKLGPLVIVGVVHDRNANLWSGTRLGPMGTFGETSTFTIPESLRSYFDRWQELVNERLDVKTVKARATKTSQTPSPTGRSSVTNAPDYRILVHYLGPKDRPIRYAIEMRPIDETWEPFFVAIPDDHWAAMNPSIRVGPGDPWKLPAADIVESVDSGWRIVRTTASVGDPEAAFLVCEKIPNLLMFGPMGGTHRKILLGPVPKNLPPLPQILKDGQPPVTIQNRVPARKSERAPVIPQKSVG